MPITLSNTGGGGSIELRNQYNNGYFGLSVSGGEPTTTTTTTSTTTTTTTSGEVTLYSNFEQYIINGVRQATTTALIRTNISVTRRLVVTSTITVTGFKFIRIPPSNWSTLGYSVTGTLSVVAGSGGTIDGGSSSKGFNTKSSIYNPSVVAQRTNTTS